MATDLELRQRFEECVERCADSMYRVAVRLTGNDTTARDLVQESYLNAWKNISSLNDAAKMRSWLFSILRFQYGKLARRSSRQIPGGGDMGFVECETSSGRLDVRDDLNLALSQLDDSFKLPLLFVAIEQMSVDEAATALDLPRGTVLSRLHRGRKKLKEILARTGTLAGKNVEDNS